MTTIFLPISRLTAGFDWFLCRVQPGPQRFYTICWFYSLRRRRGLDFSSYHYVTTAFSFFLTSQCIPWLRLYSSLSWRRPAVNQAGRLASFF